MFESTKENSVGWLLYSFKNILMTSMQYYLAEYAAKKVPH